MTGVAQATLSRIETGVMRGTVESHQRIAEALGMSLSELYSEVDDRLGRISAFSLGKRSAAAVRDAKVKCEILTQHAMKKKITPLLLTLEGRGETDVEKFEAGVEKFYFVLEGEVTARIEKKEYPLSEGGTLYFDASLPHQLSNASGKKARVFCAVSPPAL
jgi:mannose-6-phosphate isomerase-like protein (cupin superfamily)